MLGENYATYLRVECKNIKNTRLLEVLINLRKCGLTDFKFEETKGEKHEKTKPS
jgi:hypothetical protein